MASTGGAIAPVVSAASTTCATFGFFGSFPASPARPPALARRASGRLPQARSYPVLPTATRAADLGGDSLVGKSIFGVEDCATPAGSLVVFGAEALALQPSCLAAARARPRPSRRSSADREEAQPRSAFRRASARLCAPVSAREIPTSSPWAARQALERPWRIERCVERRGV